MAILGDAVKLLVFFIVNTAALRRIQAPKNMDLMSVDAMTQENIPKGWQRISKHGQTPVCIMHIPRTAGTSFTHAAHKYVPQDVGIYSDMECLSKIEKTAGSCKFATMLRYPPMHVFSQFLAFKESKWAKNKSFVANVTTWLQAFIDSRNRSTNPLGFSPLDMQSRSFVCDNTPQKYPHYTVPSIDSVIAGFNKMEFVGIAEYYQESMCLFHAKIQPEAALPTWCNCKNAKDWAQFENTHFAASMAKHAIQNLTGHDLKMIHLLTANDVDLYEQALGRFSQEIAEIEHKKNVTVLCQN